MLLAATSKQCVCQFRHLGVERRIIAGSAMVSRGSWLWCLWCGWDACTTSGLDRPREPFFGELAVHDNFHAVHFDEPALTEIDDHVPMQP